MIWQDRLWLFKLKTIHHVLASSLPWWSYLWSFPSWLLSIFLITLWHLHYELFLKTFFLKKWNAQYLESNRRPFSEAWRCEFFTTQQITGSYFRLQSFSRTIKLQYDPIARRLELEMHFSAYRFLWTKLTQAHVPHNGRKQTFSLYHPKVQLRVRWNF